MRAAQKRPPKPRQPIRILNPEARPRMIPAAAEASPAVRVDAEFEKLMPALSPDEYAQLEALLLAEGCRDPMVTWDGILVDGHNRYRICREHGIPFRTVPLSLRSRSDAEVWIIKHQFGRRNISAIARIELATKLEAIYAARAKENLKTKGCGSPNQEGEDAIPEPLVKKPKAPVHAREEAARDAGVSGTTYRKGKVVLETAPDDLKEKVKRGEVSIHAAYNEVVPKKESPAGQCRLNGQLVPDPPDVAKARKAGKIAPDVIPDIEDAGDGDEVVTFTEEPSDDATQTDEEWFASLPVWHQLGPGARVLFERDALAYRTCEEARGKFAHAVRSVLASASRKGSLPTFCHRLRAFLKINHPKHWSLCPAPEHGGCGGTGVLDITGTCTRCHGGGYQI